MKAPGLDARRTAVLGRIRQRNGNLLIGTVRKQLGAGFALWRLDEDDLGHALPQLGEATLLLLERQFRGK